MYSGFGPYLHQGLASWLIEMKESERAKRVVTDCSGGRVVFKPFQYYSHPHFNSIM